MSSKAVNVSSQRLQLKALKKINPQGTDNYGALESTFFGHAFQFHLKSSRFSYDRR